MRHNAPLDLDVKSFRPEGIGRYFTVAFLAVWLVGWAIGEIVAGGALVAIVLLVAGALPEEFPRWGADLADSGALAVVVLFLIVWLTLWTIGGIGAWRHFLRSMAGEDRIAVIGSRLEIVSGAGPFRKRQQFDRDAIRRIRIRLHDGAAVMDTASDTQVLTSFGSRPERDVLVEWLNRHLNLPDQSVASGRVPKRWDIKDEVDAACLRKTRPRARAIRSVLWWVIAGAIAWATAASRDADVFDRLLSIALTLALGAGAVLSTWARREWIVRPGELTFRWTFAAWSSERVFRNARLAVTREIDSDNDGRYNLIVNDGRTRKVIHSQLNDLGEVVDLGRWLAARTGFPFPMPEI